MTFRHAIHVLGASAVCALMIHSANAEPAAIGSFRDWSVYTSGSGRDQVCYALAQPKSAAPKGAKRDPIFFLVSSWPKRNVSNEPSVVPGYPYREGSKARVEVGSDKFEFFTKNEGTNGGAWMESPDEEKRLVEAMRRGQSMIITGTSTRGTLTRDEYSLAGITAALDKVKSSCK
ncbi:MAG: invasion associated locus B family protein [Alphaproteobacteria bacterium]